MNNNIQKEKLQNDNGDLLKRRGNGPPALGNYDKDFDYRPKTKYRLQVILRIIVARVYISDYKFCEEKNYKKFL